MRDWELEAALAQLSPFVAESAKYDLEQYSTSAHLAAQIVLCARRTFGDVEDQVVLDVGCGTGILSCACLMAGAERVVGLDVDADAIEVCRANLRLCDSEDDMDIEQKKIFEDMVQTYKQRHASQTFDL